MQQGEDEGEQGKQRGEEGVIWNANEEAYQGVNGKQDVDDEDQFGQLADEHGRHHCVFF